MCNMPVYQCLCFEASLPVEVPDKVVMGRTPTSETSVVMKQSQLSGIDKAVAL